MFYGSLVFISTELDIKKIENIIEGLVEGDVEVIHGPFDFDTNDSSGILYHVEFGNNQWINIVELDNQLAKNHIKCDIIHALTDGSTMVEIISTNALYDNYTTNPNKMYELAKLYQISLIDDPSEGEDEAELDEEAEYDDYDDYSNDS